MKNKYTVLIVEDEREVAEAFSEGLKSSTSYNFEPEIVLIEKDSLEPLLEYTNTKYDFYILDIKLKSTPSNVFSLRNIYPFLVQKRIELEGTIIMYTGHPSFDNAVKAMKLGASEFFSKAEVPPHELVKKIEEILDNRKKRIERSKMLDKLAEEHGDKWKEKYDGQIIVLVEDNVVTNGETYLDALVKYEQLLDKHKDWPLEPDVMLIHKEEE